MARYARGRPAVGGEWPDRILYIGFQVSLAAVLFLAGALAVMADVFPASQLAAAYRGGAALYDKWTSYRDVYATDLWRPARTAETGVTHHDPRAQQGLTLYTSGHDAAAYLIGMDGRIRHTWRRPYSTVWTEAAAIRQPRPDSHVYFRKAHAFANGDLLAIYEGAGDTPYGYGMVKLDRNSEVVWRYLEATHHDFDVATDGRIYALTHKISTHDLNDYRHLKAPRIEDDLVVLSPSGEELLKISLTQAIAKSPYAHLLHAVAWYSLADPLHTNAVQVIDAELAAVFPYGEAGQVMLSFRELGLGTIAVLDLDRQEIVWAARGSWLGQHDPDILPNGNILLFDNYGRHAQPGGRSRVFEFDPRTREVVWSFAGDAGRHFESAIRSSQQRLGNGNTLITESDGGRILEVAPDGNIVWEFINPERGGSARDRIPIVCWAQRLDADAFDPDFLESLPASGHATRENGI